MGISNIQHERQQKKQKVSVRIVDGDHPVKTRSLAEDRQSERIEKSESENRKIIGKFEYTKEHCNQYCSNNINDYVPPHFQVEDIRIEDEVYLDTIQAAIDNVEEEMTRSVFRFDGTPEAAQHNIKVLAAADYDIDKIIKSKSRTVCSPGSEFRSIQVLDTFMSKHENWPHVRKIITEGASNHFIKEYSDVDRMEENEALIEYNNHKGARENVELVSNAINEDVKRGFAIVLPIGSEKVIPGAMVNAVGTVVQKSMNEQGEETEKHRLTHDQTFIRLLKSLSVNNLCDKKMFLDMIYGWCFSRIIAQAIEMRRAYPNVPILAIKGDFKSAYRRLHYMGMAAAQCMVSWEGLLYMWLRLCFGGSSCPPSWCAVGETIVDLANDLLLNKSFKSGRLSSRHFKKIQKPTYLPKNIPFGVAADTMLSPPTREYGNMDIFVDDMIGICVDLPGNADRLSESLAGAVDAFCRPPVTGELPPREDCLHDGKTFFEGSPKEKLIILGWIFCFRTLTVRLPKDKHRNWCHEIDKIIKSGKVQGKKLESLIGKLSHASVAIPMSRYYLGRFYVSLLKFYNKWEERNLHKDDIRYLLMWKEFLNQAREGISMNKLTYRQPTNHVVTDACPHGIGGLSITSGRAWRLKIEEHHFKTSNNNYEFLAAVVGIWMAAINNEIEEEGVMLALTDNSSALGWLHSCNCDDELDSFRTEVAHKLASIAREYNFIIHPQHVKGDDNKAADALSRKFELSDNELTQFCHLHTKNQIPKNFLICQIPIEITSWIYSKRVLARQLNTQTQKPIRTVKTGIGKDGKVFWKKPTWVKTYSLTRFKQLQNGCWDDVLLNPSDKENTEKEDTDTPWSAKVRNSFSEGLYAKPLAVWQRSSGVTVGIHPSMKKRTPTSSLIPSIN